MSSLLWPSQLNYYKETVSGKEKYIDNNIWGCDMSYFMALDIDPKNLSLWVGKDFYNEKDGTVW